MQKYNNKAIHSFKEMEIKVHVHQLHLNINNHYRITYIWNFPTLAWFSAAYRSNNGSVHFVNISVGLCSNCVAFCGTWAVFYEVIIQYLIRINFSPASEMYFNFQNVLYVGNIFLFCFIKRKDILNIKLWIYFIIFVHI